MLGGDGPVPGVVMSVLWLHHGGHSVPGLWIQRGPADTWSIGTLRVDLFRRDRVVEIEGHQSDSRLADGGWRIRFSWGWGYSSVMRGAQH